MSKEVNVKVYTVQELGESAKERALSDWNRNNPYFYGDEARDTIEAMGKCFGLSVYRWQFDACRSDYDVRFNLDDDVLELKGDRARSWFWNNIAPKIFKPRTIWPKGGISSDTKSRKSRMSFECSCPWTGICFDMDALDPLLKFLMCENRDPDATVKSIMEDCVASLFDCLVKDVEYHSSMESFIESCDANEYTFLEDGEMVNW